MRFGPSLPPWLRLRGVAALHDRADGNDGLDAPVHV